MTSQAEVDAAYRIVWSLFTAIEKGDQETIDANWEDTDDSTLLRGWHVVAARLRLALRERAEFHGRTCGSDEWLESERLHNISLED
jgi:ketosteroid isomerase-like protein